MTLGLGGFGLSGGCDCVIVGDGVIIALLRLKEQENFVVRNLGLCTDVEINCRDHFSFCFFLTFSLLASFKAHLFYICSVKENDLH